LIANGGFDTVVVFFFLIGFVHVALSSRKVAERS